MHMKRILLTTTFAGISAIAMAQMTLENTYTNTNANSFLNDGDMAVEVVNLAVSGRKYMIRDMAASQLRIYNMNHSIWKTINLPVVTNHSPGYTSYLSENLFNLDNKLEVAVYYRNTLPNVYIHKIVIVNEDGNILNTVDSAEVLRVASVGNNTFKAVVQKHGDRTAIFSLPGTIPCDVCGNGLGVGKIVPSGGGTLENAIPNPSNGQVKIGYSLPVGVRDGRIDIYNTNGQKVKSYTVDGIFQSLDIDNSELQAGTYYYTLQAEGLRTEAKKMVVIP